MKFRICVLGGLMATAGVASAQSGNINLQGEVAVYTCVVAANGNSGTGDAVVALPTITTPAMVPGGRAGLRAFEITVGSLTQPCGAPRVATEWLAGANVDPATGFLNNQAGADMAEGVQVVLKNDLLKDIDVRDNTHSQVVDLVGGMATLNYHGEYHGGGGTLRPGRVSTGVQYKIEYP